MCICQQISQRISYMKQKTFFLNQYVFRFLPIILFLILGKKKNTTLDDITKYAAAAKSLQSYPTLHDPIDSSPPGSPVPGILQARTLEWVAISFSKWPHGLLNLDEGIGN